jgi:predicted TIM-barrel fold metal-dependent hydrolase
MIVDVAAFTGAWPSHPVQGRMDQVIGSLNAVGVDRILFSPLDGVWCRNPHLYNGPLYRACADRNDLLPVPVIDPTITTWEAEVEEAVEEGAKALRLFPNYHGYALVDVEHLWTPVHTAGLVTIIQTRMEDPRRQHPASVVADVSVSEIVEVSEKHPDIRIVMGGARTGDIRSQKEAMLACENLYADVSQADWLDAVLVLVEEGLGERLLFGSHTPLFIPHSAVARVITDVDDDVADAILGRNAIQLFGIQ